MPKKVCVRGMMMPKKACQRYAKKGTTNTTSKLL